ncbi:MAG TPA: RagB/SusD family nutrient uptake outer membrane protein, partial [Lacibacter sp.]|nr:RagB/SusD family nutrient uptake outer membrane protein [Lacibacter sp.]
MKKSIYKLLFFTVLISTVGCNKRLDVTPAQSIDEADALKTSADVQVALVGCYTQFGTTNFYGGRMFVMGELLADHNELIWSGTFQQLTQMYNKSVPVNSTFVSNTWLAGYTAINSANNVLSAIGVVDAANKNKYEGEAKFLRAAAYFELVKLYAKDWNNGN